MRIADPPEVWCPPPGDRPLQEAQFASDDDLSLYSVESDAQAKTFVAVFWGWRDPSVFVLDHAAYVLFEQAEVTGVAGVLSETKAFQSWPDAYCSGHRALQAHGGAAKDLITIVHREPGRIVEIPLRDVYAEMCALAALESCKKEYKKRVRKRIKSLRNDDRALHDDLITDEALAKFVYPDGVPK